ncbi:uncharacterized protein [Procambarus clarkii]|uniref:uncharacterized protein n=1 Tax=Procambarus clarkii TaxID=6728 RepID=UPI0037436092
MSSSNKQTGRKCIVSGGGGWVLNGSTGLITRRRFTDSHHQTTSRLLDETTTRQQSTSRNEATRHRVVKIKESEATNEIQCRDTLRVNKVQITNEKGHRKFLVYTGTKKKVENKSDNRGERRIIIYTKKPTKETDKKKGRVNDRLQTCRRQDDHRRDISQTTGARDNAAICDTEKCKEVEITLARENERLAVQGKQAYDSRMQMRSAENKGFVRSLKNCESVGETTKTYERWGKAGLRTYKGKTNPRSVVNEMRKKVFKFCEETEDKAKMLKDKRVMKERKHCTENRMVTSVSARLVMQGVKHNKGTKNSSKTEKERSITQEINYRKRIQTSSKGAIEGHMMIGEKQHTRETDDAFDKLCKGILKTNIRHGREHEKNHNPSNESTITQGVKHCRDSKTIAIVEGIQKTMNTKHERRKKMDLQNMGKKGVMFPGPKLCKGMQTSAQGKGKGVTLRVINKQPVKMTQTKERVLVRKGTAGGRITVIEEGCLYKRLVLKDSTDTELVAKENENSANEKLVLKRVGTNSERTIIKRNERSVVKGGEANVLETAVTVKEPEQSWVGNRNCPIIISGGEGEQGVISPPAPDGTPYTIKLNLAGLIHVRPTIVIISTGKGSKPYSSYEVDAVNVKLNQPLDHSQCHEYDVLNCPNLTENPRIENGTSRKYQFLMASEMSKNTVRKLSTTSMWRANGLRVS